MTITEAQTQVEEIAEALVPLDRADTAGAPWPVVAPPGYAGMNLLAGKVDLLQDFIAQSREQLDVSEARLLEIAADPQAVEPLNALSRAFHTIKGLSGFAELDHIRELAHEAENLLDATVKGDLDLDDGAMDLMSESVAMMKRLGAGVEEALTTSGYLDEVAELPSLLSRLIAATDGTAVAAAPPPESIPAAVKSGALPLADGKTSPPVDDAHLDRLIATIDEMVSVASAVSRNQELRSGIAMTLAADLDHLDMISRELQQHRESLVHLIRNAVDHDPVRENGTPGDRSGGMEVAQRSVDGIVIGCGSERYLVPTLSVVRLLRPTRNDISRVFGRGEMLAFEHEHLPLFHLGRLFDVPSARTEIEDAVVVVVEEEGRKMGLLADDLVGQQPIVVESLGEAMQGIEGVAGGAIMPDGNVALILDVAGLARIARSSNTAVAAGEAPERKDRA